MGMSVTMRQTAMLVAVDMGQVGSHQQVDVSQEVFDRAVVDQAVILAQHQGALPEFGRQAEVVCGGEHADGQLGEKVHQPTGAAWVKWVGSGLAIMH